MSQRATTERRLTTETGAVYKDPGGKLRVCLLYPNRYFVAMSSLGFQTIYHLLNEYPDVVCERAFLPEEADLEDMTRTREELLSYESQSPLQSFDVLGLSVSYELDYLNVARLLRLAKLPPLAGDRGAHHPLILAGGPVAAINPEPLAPLVDLFVVGEAEPVLADLVAALRAHAGERDDALAAAAQIPGLYVPALPARRIARQYARPLDAYPTHSRLLTPETELADLFLTEISRGCGRRCAFCVTPHCYWPLRFRSPDAVMDTVEVGLRHSNAVGLVGAAVSDHPQIDELATRIVDRGARLSVSSLRADSVSPALLKSLAAGGAKGLTIAPEAGSERLRSDLSKDLTEAQILDTLTRAARAGLREAKLYFMIGLPGEGEEDVEAIPALVRRALQETGLSHITAAAGAFVPKPNTPFEREAMLPVDELSRRLRYLREALRGTRHITLALESANWSYLEGALSRGDRRLAEVIVGAEARGGNLSAWRQAFSAAGLSAEDFASTPPPTPTPWAFVE